MYDRNNPDRILSSADKIALSFERKIEGMGKLSVLSKEDVILHLGVPDKIKVTNGMTCLIWKGRRHKVEFFMDELGRFHHKEETYY